MGSDYKKLVHALPTQLQSADCIKSISRERVINLWKDFKIVYHVISSWSPSQSDVEGFFYLDLEMDHRL